MCNTSHVQTSIFDELQFLWDQHEIQIRRADTVDEMMEDRLGQLLYVDNYSDLPPEAKAKIAQEQQRVDSQLFALSLVKNVIGQALIIAADRSIKSVSQDHTAAQIGPLVPPEIGFLGTNTPTPQVHWAYAVRCAGNYVRHAGEWKAEAIIFQSNQGNFPVITDFARDTTRRNLQILTDVLACDVQSLLASDQTYSIAQRLGLTGRAQLEQLFEQWEQAQQSSLGPN